MYVPQFDDNNSPKLNGCVDESERILLDKNSHIIIIKHLLMIGNSQLLQITHEIPFIQSQEMSWCAAFFPVLACT